MRKRSLITGAACVLLAGLAAHAEVKVTVDRNLEGTPEFKFKNVPSPLKNDAAAKGRFSIVDGQNDSNGSSLGALNNGRLPQEEDEPGANFFFQAGSEGGRLLLDLGRVIEVKQVNSYSWHPRDRAPQVYKLYGAEGGGEGFNPTPKRGTDPATCGWKLVAAVDTRPPKGEAGGQYGVSIADTAGALGKYRYFLFDVFPTETTDEFGHTFFSEIDVRAMEPAEPEVAAGARPARAKDFDYTLDVSQAPDLKDWAETKLRPEMDKWYPIWRDCLASDGFTAPSKFSVTIRPMGGVAYTSGTSVDVSAEWIRSQLKRPEWNEAAGSVIHELAHVVQQYKTRGNPGWLVEGIADYLRWFHFEPVAHRPKLRDPSRARYSDSYKTTAGFLEYVVANHDHELVLKLNAAMRQGRYSAGLWKDCTGLSAQELWTEYVASLAGPGTRAAAGAANTRPGSPALPEVATGSAAGAGLVALVNPLMGTDNPNGLSKGITIPAVALPFPMNVWTPSTSGSGYDYRRTTMTGFRQRHLHTSRMGDFANIAIMPVFGSLVVTESERASEFRHRAETAQPCDYKAHLDTWRTTAELTPTERGVRFRFTYEEAGDGFVVLDVAAARDCSVEIIPSENKIVGISRNNAGGVPADNSFANYFVVVFDRPFAGYGVWSGPERGRDSRGGGQEPQTPEGIIKEGETKLAGPHVGAYVKFDTARNPVVGCKVASSYISPEQALLNLESEIGSADFDTLRQRAEARWNEALGRAKVEGGSEDQRRTFYSCLYRAVLFPEKFYEISAQGKPVHYSPYDGKLHDGVLYTDSGFWDTFRAAHPLYNLLFPEVSAEIQQSLVNTYLESNWLPEWPGPGHRPIMIGQNSFSLFADAWVKDVRGFDAAKALEAMAHDVTGKGPVDAVGRDGAAFYNDLGYLPYSSKPGEPRITEATAKTLEYAYDDFCAAQLAKAIGKTTEAQAFAKHALNYTNLFDTKLGFMRERKADGSWNEPFYPEQWGGGFTEGCSWHWTWCVFHDVPGLVKLMGGDEAFANKLDEVFTTSSDFKAGTYGRPIHEMTEMTAANLGQYAHGNEPVHHLIYLYDYAGQPWKAQARVRQVMTLLYSPTPDGYCGDEDTGQMSSWYVFSALGFYPVCPGDPNYVIGSPLFDSATLKLGNGKTFTITTKGNGWQEYYIRSATLDGETLDKTYFSHQAVLKGGELAFTLGSQPNKRWGVEPENRPPSALAQLMAAAPGKQ
jgi:predicted alpha-1,2-mannosidase